MPRIEFETFEQREAFHWWKTAKLENPGNRIIGEIAGEGGIHEVFEIDEETLVTSMPTRNIDSFRIRAGCSKREPC